MNNITLICPTYRNPKYLDLFLKSAVENRVDENNHIIIIIDGYIEESKSILSKYSSYPNVFCLEFEENRGMQYAINAGVMQAQTSYVFIVNDDNVMPTEWDSRIVKIITDYDHNELFDNYVITIDQVEPTGPSMFNFIIKDLGKTVEEFNYNEWLTYEKEIADQSLTDKEDGHIFPFIVKKKYYMAVGGLDTYYSSPNICDWDLFLKFELLGFQFPRIRTIRLYHFGSVATKKNSESEIFKKRESVATQEFIWKWGFAPFNQPNINSKLPRGIKIYES